MDNSPLKQWMSAEIIRLRERSRTSEQQAVQLGQRALASRQEGETFSQEADALQRALDRFEGSAGDQKAPLSKRSAQTSPATRKRISKYEPVIQAFERETIPLSVDDMLAIAHQLNVTIDRANMRSLVHAQKKLGRAVSDGDYYVWPGPEAETASTKEEDAVRAWTGS